MAKPTSAAAAPVAPEAEADDYADDDSSLDDGASLASSTSSLASSIRKYRSENGRTYHAYKEGSYALPNDEGENDRLDHMHHLVSLTQEGKLYLAPLPKGKIHRVLDVGTGTGIWAIDFADAHPETEVVGVDLSPIQPSFIPPNVSFQIDDLEADWTFTHKFDFIYSRIMTGSFQDWPKFFAQSYENLNPGGYIELNDIIYPILNDDNSWPKDSALLKWSTLVTDAMTKFGRPLNSALKYEEQLKAAGFKNIVKSEYRWPINRWPKDPKLKEFGLWTRENLVGGLFGLSAFVFTNLIGWTLEELEAFLPQVKKDFYDTKIHSYFPVVVYYAQKPEAPKAPEDPEIETPEATASS